MTDAVDIAIIGAGAAGLAAAVRLAQAPVTVQVLEARDRVGGRAHTLKAGGFDLDLGCGWLHSADLNPFSRIAEALSFELDKTPPHWTRESADVNFSQAAQVGFRRALAALEARIETVAAGGRDQPVSELMSPDDPFSPLLNAFSAFYNGAEFDQVSTLDFAAYQDTEVNWRVARGYGALIARFGAAAPVRLNAPVRRIDRRGPRLRLETALGDLLARMVIVTVPTSLIAEGVLAFTPDLPEMRQAAEALPLGLANKVFLAVDHAEALPVEGRLFGDPSRTETGSYNLRPFGRPMIEAYLGGRHARALEQEGPQAAAAFAIEELVRLLGSDMRARLTPVAGSAWAQDPWALGSYSHATPGGAWARAALAQPAEDRILFAGEACSPHFFSTAHGAAESGTAAAAQALALLGVA